MLVTLVVFKTKRQIYILHKYHNFSFSTAAKVKNCTLFESEKHAYVLSSKLILPPLERIKKGISASRQYTNVIEMSVPTFVECYNTFL